MAKTNAKAAAPKPKSKGSDYDNTNRGVLFVNDKDGNEARPDFTGKLTIDPSAFEVGEDGLIEIRLAAWKKDSDRVGEFLSLSASVPQTK